MNANSKPFNEEVWFLDDFFPRMRVLLDELEARALPFVFSTNVKCEHVEPGKVCIGFVSVVDVDQDRATAEMITAAMALDQGGPFSVPLMTFADQLAVFASTSGPNLN